MHSPWKYFESHKIFNFAGSIPASLGNLTQLTELHLSYNHFIGEILSSLSNLKELSYLDLSDNNFSGKFSSSLSVGNA
jgi:Ran GTPase-activating protein (RanGAP) involved in mRNA processing and transport